MSRALFVSDIHISSSRDPKCGLFIRFLDACIRNKINELFLVGDIFDFWVADRSYFTREYNEVIVKIRQAVHSGIQVHYFEGNHDLDLRLFWQHQVGATVYSEPAFFRINNRRLRVEHGDQMDPEDKGYLFLRRLLRSTFMVLLGRYLPNPIVRWIGSRASERSRDYTSTTKAVSDSDVRAKIRAHALAVASETPFDILISGHVHVAEDTEELVGRFKFRSINLGTWLKKPIVLDMTDKSIDLRPVEEFLEE